MATRFSKGRASMVTYSELEAGELQVHVEKLAVKSSSANTLQDIHTKIEAAQCIRQTFLDGSSAHSRDAFRHINGFQTMIKAVRDVSELIDDDERRLEDVGAPLDLLQSLLGLLSSAIQDHWGNGKYFRKGMEEGGWDVLTDLLQSLVARDHTREKGINRNIKERLFGCLLACALDDETVVELFSKIRRQIETSHVLWDPQDVSENRSEQSKDTGVEELLEAEKSEITLETLDMLRKALGSQAYLHNPEVIPLMLKIWIDSRKNSPAGMDQVDSVLNILPCVISHITSLSTHNLAAVHNTGALCVVLPCILDVSLSSHHLSQLGALAAALLRLGITNLSDAHFLYRNATSSKMIAKLLHLALTNSHSPAYFHFDLSLHGFASIELPDIGRAFPPLSSSAGYTLSIWLHVVHFDRTSHTTLFGAFDMTQTCFVLVYLEKDTGNLILQTSVTSSRPSVRFKTFSFKENQWYHICLAHRRPRTTSSSRASLFVDGEFIEQLKAHYPLPPPLMPSDTETPILPSLRGRSRPVQAFLGTPRDLASNLGRGVITSQWRIASAHLFNLTLSDDLIAVHKQLGPRYYGNYQDCLGSFQTYEASAALNLRNELLHPGKEEKSDIVTAIRSKASVLLPESEILLNISPVVVLDDDERNNIDESQLIKNISKPAAKILRNITRGGRTAIVINGAFPAIYKALFHPYGFATLTGDPIVIVPRPLDNAAWQIGGCGAVCLALVERAQGHEEITRAVDILLESVRESWRNSEAMERENGFGVLSNLLSSKLVAGEGVTANGDSPPFETNSEGYHDQLAMKVLIRILGFVGFNSDFPENSVLNNPLAYRILLVDLDVWRTSPPEVQNLYYRQFTTFAVGSKSHHFNAKRLARMRIVKKWLESLKEEQYRSDTFDYFIKAFQSLLKGNMSSDTLRSLALYVTYEAHRPAQNIAQLPRPSKSVLRQNRVASVSRRRQTLPISAETLQDKGKSLSQQLTHKQMGIRVLEMYADLLCQKETINIRKFARTVTNKWLLHLLASDEASIVLLSTRILARVLIINGSSYVDKFREKTGGFATMQHRLRRWWNVPAMWPLCFAILFGQDVGTIDFEKSFDFYNLMTMFMPNGKLKVVYPEVFPVITAMLRTGLNHVTENREALHSKSALNSNGHKADQAEGLQTTEKTRHRSMSLNIGHASRSKPSTSSKKGLLSNAATGASQVEAVQESASMLHAVTRFLAEVHSSSQAFRDFTVQTAYVQELLFVLFPIVVSTDVVSPETELHSRDSALTFNGSDVIIRPLSQMSMKAPQIVRTASVEPPSSPTTSRAQPLRRGSSYILVTSEPSKHQPSSAKLQPAIPSRKDHGDSSNVSISVVEELLQIVIAVFIDQILSRKDFPGMGLFMKVPPGFQEHQAYFESFILRNILSQLRNTIRLDQRVLCEPRVLTNLARFAAHLAEALFEGWFIDGAEAVVDFLGDVLEYIQRPDISQLKSVRLCSQIVTAIRNVVLRVVLLRLSEADEPSEMVTVAFLDKLTYWQTIIFASEESQEAYLRLICYLLYAKLMSTHERVRSAAANLWRIILVQKPEETAGTLLEMMTEDDRHLSKGFKKIVELDNKSFLEWVDDHRDDLDSIFFGRMAKAWEDFVIVENRRTEESSKTRISKRRERLKVWISDDLIREDIIRRHEISSDHWSSNIYASENLKRQRAVQDQQDTVNFNHSTWTKMKQELRRPCGLFDDFVAPKWQLDQTEGRNRMRMRLIPDQDAHLHIYQAKRAPSKSPASHRPSLNVNTKTLPKTSTSVSFSANNQNAMTIDSTPIKDSSTTSELFEGNADTEEGFEMVEEPADHSENYEDKNRKVMRSLQRGDQVEHVHNISRIIGLEACEGLLILGKNALYLLDHYFQRSDGEIVNVWQAPFEERDSYLQMIAGREAGDHSARPDNVDHETRSWRWDDVLSISKRRFLFRDVAIEVFFVDGRSYLLTVPSAPLRDEIHSKILSKASGVAGGTSFVSNEDSWRIESLRSPEDTQQSFGSRFANVFSQSTSSPAAKQWMKGEISNFHYLMLINTMAGRTFNDLTQYPVFPWVLADYSSEELDLTNPRSFRDLTKPMGCQTPERQAEFRERYQSFAEMGDHNSPPFHYGTHYSSAMIVTTYLIRLQPFVQSYLLLQGGSFDHPDRLFYDIGNAWLSASRDNMTDVRELTPEFYYLPDFLVNANGYDFGSRQGDGGSIDTVQLPRWAKGDPKIFIAKHREALESDYVSRHLHQWIDLIFGHKQRGDAALEATNVFHHLSYGGAKNLDEIDDPVERLATIGIIHNFGQTPHQVFQRAHPQRDDIRHKAKKLDTLADTLTRLPFPLSESEDRVASLQYSWKHDRLLRSSAFRLNIPPNYDKYMEWGFVDGSVRFYTYESKKLIGLFEHVHQGQLSGALFADSRTLITAGADSTISVWAVISTPKSVDLQPKACLFGHRSAVTTLAVSRSFSTLVSASSDGQVLLWDLNRLEFVRKLAKGPPVECARINDVTGVIMLCRGPEVALFTLNAELLLEQHVCVEGDDNITSCAFYEGSGNEYLEQDLIFTGHKRGVVNIWNMTIHDGKFILEHVKRMNHMDQAGFNISSAMTCILPMAQVVYVGDDDGRVYEWDCIQRHG